MVRRYHAWILTVTVHSVTVSQPLKARNRNAAI